MLEEVLMNVLVVLWAVIAVAVVGGLLEVARRAVAGRHMERVYDAMRASAPSSKLRSPAAVSARPRSSPGWSAQRPDPLSDPEAARVERRAS